MGKFENIKELNEMNETELLKIKGGNEPRPEETGGTFYTPGGTGTTDNPDSSTDGDI